MTLSATVSPAKRVLYFYPHRHLDTGSPMVLLRMIDLLDRRRFTPLFLATGEGALVTALRERDVEIVSGSVDELTPRAPLRGARGIMRQSALLRDHAIDLIHLNQFGWNQDLVVAAWLKRVPVILHVHHREHVAPQNLNRFLAKRVLVVSEAHKSNITGFARIRHKCDVLYNPVDIDVYGGGRSIRAALGLRSDDFVIGTIAQIQHLKGIDLLLETARRVLAVRDDVTFLHIGPPGHNEAEFARAMKERARDADFRGRVQFLGARTDIPDLLASMDVLFHPTRQETFGLVVVEAMASALPVVCSRAGGLPEIVATSEIGCALEGDSPDRYAAALLELIAQPERARAMGQAGRRSLRGRFDETTSALRLAALYDRCLGNRELPAEPVANRSQAIA
jgi:glycosyltransferase involved in cell wall biosynthesis